MTQGDPLQAMHAPLRDGTGDDAGRAQPAIDQRFASAAEAATDAEPLTACRTQSKMADKGRLGSVALSLRQVYTSTLEESVPDAMMDLLKKLD